MKKKNIILISFDSLRPDFLRCYGNNKIQTPNFDFLARNGILFHNTIAQAPYTASNHASMLTGFYPFNHGVRKQYSRTKLAHGALTTFDKMRSASYLISSFVSSHVFSPEYGYEWDIQQSAKLRNIRQFIRTNSNSRYFMFIHFWLTHCPYKTKLPIESWKEVVANLFTSLTSLRQSTLALLDYCHYPGIEGITSKYINRLAHQLWSFRMERVRKLMQSGNPELIELVKEGYKQAVKLGDFVLGKIIQYLDNADLLTDSIVVVTADHGESFNEHNIIAKVKADYETGLDYEHGHSLTDNVLKVPLIISCPDCLPKGKEVFDQVRSIDILPTVLDVAGVCDHELKQLDGKSALRLIQGSDPSPFQFSYSETLFRNNDKVCIRDNNYKLILDNVQNQQQLYKLSMGETKDISDKYPEKVVEMRRNLTSLINSHHRDFKTNKLKDSEFQEVRQRLRDLGYL